MIKIKKEKEIIYFRNIFFIHFAIKNYNSLYKGKTIK